MEANLYGQIVRGRIEIIKTLEEKVDANEREKAIQTYLFDHLWLLDPSWERVEGTEIIQSRVKKLFKDVDATLTDAQRNGRLDIAYRKSAGQHVIVELKRPERVVSTSDLIAQIEKYLSGMQSLLEAQGTPHEVVQFVVLLGAEPSDWISKQAKERSHEMLKVQKARIVFYEKLLRDARQMYQDYMKNRQLVDKLQQVIQAIDDYAPPSAPQRPAITTRA